MFAKTEVVTKALSLIQKLQHKYGFKPKFYEITPDNVESDTPESNSPQLYTPEPLERERLLPTISEEPENQDQVGIYLDSLPTAEICTISMCCLHSECVL